MSVQCEIHKTLNTDTNECEWSWLALLVIWIIANVGPMWYVIWSNQRSKIDPVRDKEYMALARIDYENWSYTTAFVTHFFFLPRFTIGWSAFFLLAILARIISIGYDPYKLPEPRAKLIRKLCDWTAMFVVRCACIHPQNVRVNCDYSKWLGPDYEKTYEGAGIHVTNHLTVFDSCINWAY